MLLASESVESHAQNGPKPDFQTLQALRREGAGNAIFLSAKLDVILRQSSAWPDSALTDTLRDLLEITLAMNKLRAIQERPDGLDLDRRDYAYPWKRLPSGAAMPAALATAWKTLGGDFASATGCRMRDRAPMALPPQFWRACNRRVDAKRAGKKQ
jgi:hypothetical protein